MTQIVFFHSLDWKLKDQHKSLEKEVNNRKKFTAEICEAVEFLENTCEMLEGPEAIGIHAVDVENEMHNTLVCLQCLFFCVKFNSVKFTSK